MKSKARERRTAAKVRRRRAQPRHDLPRPPSMRVLAKTVLNRSEREARHIREYIESQAPDDAVKHLEKVTTERIFGRQYDVWDVWTDKERWWVITSPTNLYRQKDYVSMDYTLSFHVGVTARVMATHEPPVEDHGDHW